MAVVSCLLRSSLDRYIRVGPLRVFDIIRLTLSTFGKAHLVRQVHSYGRIINQEATQTHQSVAQGASFRSHLMPVLPGLSKWSLSVVQKNYIFN